MHTGESVTSVRCVTASLCDWIFSQACQMTLEEKWVPINWQKEIEK